MDHVAHKVIFSILRWAMMGRTRAGCMSLCLLLKEGMAHRRPNNNPVMMFMCGTGYGLSIFCSLWHWGLVRDMLLGSPNEVHQSVRVCLHFAQFVCAGRSTTFVDHGKTSLLMLENC